MDDLRTSLLARIDRGLDAMAKAPRMFGSPESLESQALLLLEFRNMVLRPHLTRQNPGEIDEAYEKFVNSTFSGAPATMLAYILKAHGKQSELPEYIQRLRKQLENELPEEDAYEHSDMVLDIAFKAGRDIPSFAKICEYYERFMKALRAILRHVPKEKTDPKDTLVRATEYAVPEIRVLPGKDGGTLIRIPLDQPKFGQLSIGHEWMSEQRVREAIKQAAKVAVWADDDEPVMGNLRALFPDDERRKTVAAHTIRMLPEAGMESVRVGGKLLEQGPVELRPSQALRILPVLKEGELPMEVSRKGFVRAVDLDQKWFRLKYSDRTIKCWVHDAPEYLDMASQALAKKTKVIVTGDEFRAAYKRPFVTTKTLVAA